MNDRGMDTMMQGEKLTESDIHLLLDDPSPETRSRTAARVAANFDPATLTEKERRLAEDIFRLMMKDAEVRVREALALQLRNRPGVPHDVVLGLARDVDSVALPMLQWSEVLTDEDLIAIVRSSGVAKQIAVAGRPSVSGRVSQALVETDDARVVSTLVANQRAEIPEPTIEQVVERFGHHDDVQLGLAARSALPITVVERLVAKASDRLRQQLLAHGSAPEALTSELLLQARERAVVGLLGDNIGDDDVEALVHQLDAHGRLTPSIVLRALCLGDLAFFEAALARLSGTSLANARALIYDTGPLGLRAIFDKAGLPAAYFAAIRAGVDVARLIQLDGQPHDRERRSRKIVERVLTQCGDLGVDLDQPDIEYLLGHMARAAT